MYPDQSFISNSLYSETKRFLSPLSLQIAAMSMSHSPFRFPVTSFVLRPPPDIHGWLLWTNNNAVQLILQAPLTAYRKHANRRWLHSLGGRCLRQLALCILRYISSAAAWFKALALFSISFHLLPCCLILTQDILTHHKAKCTLATQASPPPATVSPLLAAASSVASRAISVSASLCHRFLAVSVGSHIRGCISKYVAIH